MFSEAVVVREFTFTHRSVTIFLVSLFFCKLTKFKFFSSCPTCLEWLRQSKVIWWLVERHNKQRTVIISSLLLRARIKGCVTKNIFRCNRWRQLDFNMSTDFKRAPASVNKFYFLNYHWLSVVSTGSWRVCHFTALFSQISFCSRFLPFRAKTMEVGKNCENLTFTFAVVYILCVYNNFVFLSDVFDFREVMLM